MAKIIKLTPDILDGVRKDFEEILKNTRLADGKISFSKSFASIQRKATVYFTEIAWLKMQTLIREFDKEVAWHGLAYRCDDETKDEYIIKDILVYPQEVTGSTVNTDQQKYQSWLMAHDDEVFNNIRMQGHSHVNLGVTPSGVDLSLYERILDQLDDSMFYIFLIYNKRGEKTYMIYDMAKNIMFETSDVTVKIIDDGSGLSKFLEDAKSKVQNRTYSAASGNYNHYQQGTLPVISSQQKTGGYNSKVQTTTVPTAKPEAKEEAKKKEDLSVASAGISGKKRKGKRKGKNKSYNGSILLPSQSQSHGYGWYDDDELYGYGYTGHGY